MDILEKIKRENYRKYKDTPEFESELKNWLNTNTAVNTNGLNKSEMVFLIRNGYTENPVCICGTPIQFKHNKYKTYCSCKCSGNSKQTLERRKKTVQTKYGCDNVFQNPTIKNKCKTTSIKNWGESSYMKTEQGRAKNTKTVMEKYGVENPFQIPEVKESNKKTWLDNKDEIIKKIRTGGIKYHINKLNKLGELHRFTLNFTENEYYGVDRKHKYPFTCTTCGMQYNHHIDDGIIPLCPICNPSNIAKGTSNIEQRLLALVSKISNEPVTANDRISIAPLELDILIPNKNIAIELNGLYWHSEIAGNTTRQYHLNKTKKCAEKNIKLIHIFEDEMIYQEAIVRSKLMHLMGSTRYKLYGRKCKIKHISAKQSSTFLNKYHIQGEDKASIRLGAFYKNRLIAVMTFGKRRFDNKDGYELIRYATIRSFSCIGVAGKLLKHFEREYAPTAIVSYADLRWSSGGLYSALGFTHIRNSSPNYFYIKDSIHRYNRQRFQKHKLKDKLEIFDPLLSEWENMKANGYDRIWDCGTMVFEKTY